MLLAGVDGFEPSSAGVKVLCLTAWRHPNADFHFLPEMEKTGKIQDTYMNDCFRDSCVNHCARNPV